MQSDHQFYPRKEPPLENQVGNNYMHDPVAAAFGAVLPPGSKHLKPFHDVEFQPSEVCPKNFIIFDQTDHRSQIMYHPALALNFSTPGLNIHSTNFHDNFGGKEINNDVTEMSPPMEEDSDDIDALLSSEEEEEEQAEYDEEEVSTARTNGNYGSSSPESCSTYGSKARKNRASSSVQKSSSSSGSSCKSERKRHRVKKMVRALQGIVPGGNQMNSVAVLDEAVRYLKSLKVEVQKLGVGNLKN